MVCNSYDIEIYDLRMYARDKRRKKDVRDIINMAADVLENANNELKACRKENEEIKKDIAKLFSVLSDLKAIEAGARKE